MQSLVHQKHAHTLAFIGICECMSSRWLLDMHSQMPSKSLSTGCLFACACTCTVHGHACETGAVGPSLGEGGRLVVHCDSYNLANWDGGGFGLNLS